MITESEVKNTLKEVDNPCQHLIYKSWPILTWDQITANTKIYCFHYTTNKNYVYAIQRKQLHLTGAFHVNITLNYWKACLCQMYCPILLILQTECWIHQGPAQIPCSVRSLSRGYAECENMLFTDWPLRVFIKKYSLFNCILHHCRLINVWVPHYKILTQTLYILFKIP